jgi:hypothetical protein
VSASESGAKDPRAEKVERLLHSNGYRLAITRLQSWASVGSGRKTISVPSFLPTLELSLAFAQVDHPHSVAWSGQGSFNLSDRRESARAYEILLSEGLPADLERFVDGALLVDIWDDLFLPRHVKSA